MKHQKTNEEKFPSVKYAYELSLQSYDWAINTIASFTGWITTINLALITLVSSRFVQSATQYSPFKSCLFYTAMELLFVTIIYAIIVKARGYLILITPKQLYNKSLRFSEWEFKRTVIENAKNHFERNKALVNRKSVHLTVITLLFFIEIILLVLWIVQIG
jgi:hypothetical protein